VSLDHKPQADVAGRHGRRSVADVFIALLSVIICKGGSETNGIFGRGNERQGRREEEKRPQGDVIWK
jgi:hypothetical protein